MQHQAKWICPVSDDWAHPFIHQTFSLTASPEIYYINKETFKIQIIVTWQLSPEENLCLTDNLQDTSLINRLADDYAKHKENDIYTKYLNQLTTANYKTKGESSMVCEGLFNLFGTSSAEVMERARKESEDYYLPKIKELSVSNEQLSSSNQILTSSNQILSSQNNYLKNLLRQNNISFDLDAVSGEADMPGQL